MSDKCCGILGTINPLVFLIKLKKYVAFIFLIISIFLIFLINSPKQDCISVILIFVPIESCTHLKPISFLNF